MKIIYQGKDKPWWVGAYATCPFCGTIMRLEDDDVGRPDVAVSRAGERLTFPCPSCDRDMDATPEGSISAELSFRHGRMYR